MRNVAKVLGCACAAALLLGGCGGSDCAPDRGPDDVPADLLPGDLSPSDVPDVPDVPCSFDQVPKPPADPTRTKFGLTMFHWNTQYVAGGLLATWADGTPLNACDMLYGEPDLCQGWTDDALVDWQLTESFEPILDLYLSHPTWRTTFEVPGLMIEAMEARHPAMLAKLQAAAQSGQIEISSFHWSAQLFLAYPARDLEKSQEINASVFERTCLPLSPVVFNQEGMSGIGKHAYMAQHGFTADMIHENMFRYYQWGTRPWPVYTSRGVKVVVGMEEGLKEGPSVDPESGIQVVWPFFDDGEVLATILGPYLAPMSGADLEAVKAYEAQVQAYVDQGYTMTTVTSYLADLAARGVVPKELPPIVDSTWQPIDTEGIHQWMGHRGRLDTTWPWERDNDERTATYRSGQVLAAADVLLQVAKASGKDVRAPTAALVGAWQDLARAEVSDATGINPWPGEFVYGMAFAASAKQAGEQAITGLLASLEWPHALINVGTGTATRMDDLPMAEPPAPIDAPFEVTVEAPGRTVDVSWFQGLDGASEMHLVFGPMADPTKPGDAANRRVAVTFPRYEDVLRYTPALSDHEVLEQPLSTFTLQDGQAILPLPNGLIGLGNGWWAIKHCTFVHLAAIVPFAQDAPRVVQFVDETAIPDDSRTWMFSVLQGTKEQALALANRLNSFPVVIR